MKSKILIVAMVLFAFAAVKSLIDAAISAPISDVSVFTETEESTTPVKAQKLSRKQQRELGLRPLQVLRGLRELAKDGDIESGMSAQEISFVYVAEVSASEKYGGAWQKVHEGVYGVDWDNLFVFIEKLIELFLKIWPLFVYNSYFLAPVVMMA